MRRPLVLVLIVAAVLVAAAVVGGILIAQAVARGDALAQNSAAGDDVRAALAEAEASRVEADEVVALAADPLLPADALAAVTESHELLEATVAEADDAFAVDVDALGTEEIHGNADGLRSLATRIVTDDSAVDAALTELRDALGSAAPTVEETNFDGNNAPRIAFRDAVEALAVAPPDQVGESVGAYVDTAHALEASHAAELAEKAGALFDARMAVQEFARSLSGGVILEFDWDVTVNGYGTGGSYGGTSYWRTADGGQATVTLSDSVAAQWPGAGVQALVVHEVGHAILAREDCNILFFESDLYPGEEESWATAWAIGRGHTADGSGESVYGRPSDALIALSTQCR
jgi:hypothetical protein